MAAGDAKPVPIKNSRYRVTFPIFDADGDLVTGATSPDSERSIDGGTFADCSNEATEIATSSGMYYLDLNASEMNGDTVAIIVKSGTGKTTPVVLYPATAGFDEIYSDTTIIYSDTTAIHSDTTIIASDVVILVSDTTAIHSDTTIIASDVVQIYSDTTIIYSDTTAIHSETTQMQSDTAAIESELILVHSETTVIQSDTTAIESELIVVHSETTAIQTDTGNIYSDTTIIYSDTTVIEASGGGLTAGQASDLAAIESELILVHSETTVIQSDTTVIEGWGLSAVASDTAAVESELIVVHSETTAIQTSVVALNDISAADVNAQVLDVLNVDTFSELTGVPADDTTLTNMIRWLYILARNKITQTATVQTIYADDTSTSVATSSVSDDGTTATRNEFA